uniref:Uncharacterized protein n=1 Tax=Onchocerca volvulus TaxID=6282 RepID=A0A8R1XY44_ONCVO
MNKSNKSPSSLSSEKLTTRWLAKQSFILRRVKLTFCVNAILSTFVNLLIPSQDELR